MMINATDDADDPHRVHTSFAQDASSPSENWDDDFEFQPGPAEHTRDREHDATDAPPQAGHSHEQEESWDDAYEDDDPHASPVKRTPKVDDDDVEDWDSSDNEAHDEHDHEEEHHIHEDPAREFGVGFEEEDKTVTARSSSSRVRAPPPPLPTPSLPSHAQHPQHPPLSFHFYAPPPTLPQPPTSPTLSSFSIPLSSNRASIYSQDPLVPSTSNSSAPHLSMRSYPEAAGSTPPRKGRRLRKKSRPPEADIFELEDREPDPVVPESNRPVTPPSRPTSPLRPASPSPTDSPTDTRSPQPTPSPSLLTRIGSFKRWARRSMGPDDPAVSGWRRAKSSTGPSETGRIGKSSIGPEELALAEEDVGHEMRPISPSPAQGSAKKAKARRSRGESASGQKAGWFFRAGGGGSEREELSASASLPAPEAPPVVTQTPEPSPSKRGSTLGLRRKAKEADAEREGETPTPKKTRGRLVPVLKVGGSGSKSQPQPQPEAEPKMERLARDGTHLYHGPRPLSMQPQPQPSRSALFPRHGAASVGRSAGAPLSISVASNREEQEDVETKDREKEGGMRSLINGVRRLSLVGASAGHKRTKSTGGDGGIVETEAARKGQKKDVAVRPRSRTEDCGVPRASDLCSDTRPVSRSSVLGMQRRGEEVHTLLPPVELDSPSSARFAGQGSLPWGDYDPASGSSAGPSPVTRSSVDHSGPLSPLSTHPSTSNGFPNQRQSLTGGQSFSASATSLLSGSPSKQTRTPTIPIPVPTPTQSFGTLPRSRTAPQPSQGTTVPQLPSYAPSTPAPHSASLGRSTSSPSHSGPALRRNSLGDLKLHTPPRGELKIPARISRAQQGLRRDMGMVREFAGCVEQLKRLQATYTTLLGNLRAAYDASPVSPASRPTSPTQVQFHLPSRPPSQSGTTRKITTNPNPSVQSVHHMISPPSTTQTHPITSARPSQDVSRELLRLEHEYGIWWECAELLVELGSGTGSGTESNPNLATQSASAVNTPAGEPLKELAAVDDIWRPTPGKHVASMSEPGSIFEQALPGASVSKGPPQASPPHPSQWRASTGRHDLNARQLRLLKDMLNTPDPASLVYVAGPYGYGPGYPHPQPHLRSYALEEGEGAQPWAAWNPSTVTLPSEESSADPHIPGAPYSHLPGDKLGKEKKRRASRLGILGLREILRSLKRNAVAEGILSGGHTHRQHGSESSTSASNSAEDDHYNRRRSPYHQHDEHHGANQGIGPDVAPLSDPPPRSAMPKSPRRPSLASIFRLGQKGPKIANGRSKEASPNGNGNNTPEDERQVDIGHGAAGLYSDWDRMSRSDLDLAVPTIGSGTATVRGKKAPASSSNSSMNLPHQYTPTPLPNVNISTPKRTPATSQTSLWDSSPPSGTPPQSSRLPLSIAEEDGSLHTRKLQTTVPVRQKERTPSWSQAKSSSRPTSRNGRTAVTGTVRSAPPPDLSSTPDTKLALTPENIKPLLEYAREVSTRLGECVAEVRILLNANVEPS